MKCKQCNIETTNPKYCSSSCAATANNTGRRRHGSAPGQCKLCGNQKANVKSKYCSRTCFANARRKSISDIAAANANRQARYRAKHGYVRAYAVGANANKIKEIYANCPDGYEVDHIIPLSKGGLHHENNLQYLTIRENRTKGAKII